MEGEYRLNDRKAGVFQGVLDGTYRHAGVIGIAGNEGAPAVDLHLYRETLIFQMQLCKGETCRKICIFKAGQSVRGAFASIGCVGWPEIFPGWDRSFQNLGAIFYSPDRDGRKQERFVEHIRCVPDRYMRDGACSFETDHP